MTLAAALAHGRSKLARSGSRTASLDARVLLGHVAGLTREQLIIEEARLLSLAQWDKYDALVERRLAREPVAYLVGEKEFFGLSFKVTPDTLIPRPDTETLVEVALGFCRELAHSPRILDLGTGSGAILLALLHACPEARGVGVDRSPGALGVALANARDLGLASRAHFVQGDWAAGIDEPFDVIVTNPPYINTADMADLMPDVMQFEPAAALDGGLDGLDPLRIIAPEAARLLSRPGLFCVEIGLGQAQTAKAILEDEGFQAVACVSDLNNIPRCITARQPDQGLAEVRSRKNMENRQDTRSQAKISVGKARQVR